jgi:hypothetical protein
MLYIRGIPQPLKSTSKSTSGDVTRFLSRKKKETGEVTRLPRSESTPMGGNRFTDSSCISAADAPIQKTTYSKPELKPLLNVINHNTHSEGEGIDVKADVI